MKSETLAWVDVAFAVICVVMAFGIFFLWSLDRLTARPRVIFGAIFLLLLCGFLINAIFWNG